MISVRTSTERQRKEGRRTHKENPSEIKGAGAGMEHTGRIRHSIDEAEDRISELEDEVAGKPNENNEKKKKF